MSRYSAVEIVAGLLVSVVAVGVGIFALNKFSYKVRIHSGCNTIKAFFADVDGLRVGSEVMLSGVSIGTVTSLHLNPQDYRGVVEMCVQKEILLPTDSSASITHADLMGKKYVNIIPGANEQVMDDGATLKNTSTAMSMASMIEKMVDQLLK